MSEIQVGAPGTGVPMHETSGPIARLIGVFTSPAKTFASIANRPGWDWIVPVVLAGAVTFGYLTVAVPKIDVDAAVAQQMVMVEKMSQGNLTDEKRTEIEQQTRDSIVKGRSVPRRLMGSCFLLIPLFFVPAVYHLIAKAFGKAKSYMGVVACYAYLLVIPIVTGLLATIIASARDSLDANDVQFMRVLKSNPAAFMDFHSTSKVVLALLSSLDIFDAVLFVLTTIAISKATTFTTKGAAILVGCWWGFYLLVKLGGAALMSAFMG